MAIIDLNNILDDLNKNIKSKINTVNLSYLNNILGVKIQYRYPLNFNSYRLNQDSFCCSKNTLYRGLIYTNHDLSNFANTASNCFLFINNSSFKVKKYQKLINACKALDIETIKEQISPDSELYNSKRIGVSFYSEFFTALTENKIEYCL